MQPSHWSWQQNKLCPKLSRARRICCRQCWQASQTSRAPVPSPGGSSGSSPPSWEAEFDPPSCWDEPRWCLAWFLQGWDHTLLITIKLLRFITFLIAHLQPPLPHPLCVLVLIFSSRSRKQCSHLWQNGSASWRSACSPPAEPGRRRSESLCSRDTIIRGRCGGPADCFWGVTTDGWRGCSGCLLAACRSGWRGTWWSWAPTSPWRSCARRLSAAERSWSCRPGWSEYWAASALWRDWDIWCSEKPADTEHQFAVGTSILILWELECCSIICVSKLLSNNTMLDILEI